MLCQRRRVRIAREAFTAPHRVPVFAAAMHAAALINSGRHVEAGDVVVHAEAGLAALSPAPEDLAATVPALVHALCRRPRTPAVPRCAGIEPTEPALPGG